MLQQIGRNGNKTSLKLKNANASLQAHAAKQE